ncbi:MAG: hypothetical protein ACOC16_03465 [Nanoarchaeota archaeon]
MKLVKIIFYALIFVFFITKIFSIGIYEGNDYETYNFYTNNTHPDITINISSGNNPIRIIDTILYADGDEYIYKDNTTYLPKLTNKIFEFDIQENLSLFNDIHFKLFVYSANQNIEIIPKGDKVDFSLIYDNQKPQLINFEYNSQAETLTLEFNEPIQNVIVEINNDEIFFNNIEKEKIKNDNNNNIIVIPIDNINLLDDFNTANITFKDLAGNTNTYSQQIYNNNNPLIINLITKKEEANLKYNYNKNNTFSDFFDNTIYTSQVPFQLKIETNKEATCYFSSSLTNFKEFNEISSNNKKTFQTNNHLTHTIDVTQLDNNIWVACVNNNYEEEIAYLNSDFNNELIKIQTEDYNNQLEITNIQPNNLLTNTPFDVYAQTNKKAFCYFSINDTNYQKIIMDSDDYINFEKTQLNLESQNYELEIECFDVFENTKTTTQNFEIDLSQGVQVASYTPHYTTTQDTNIEITLTEFSQVDCRYSYNPVPNTQFETLESVSGTNLQRTFSVSNLEQGTNQFYVYCKKNNEITQNTIEITYDQNGITINNFTFINNGYESSNYFGSNQEINFKFNVSSIIDIDEYILNANINDEEFEKSFTSTSHTIKENFSSTNQLKLTAINEMGSNTSRTISINYDSTPPILTFNDQKNAQKSIQCIDSQSGCAEVFYGVSQTSIQCNPNALYDIENNTALNVENENYLCAQAFNYAGHKTFEIISLTQNKTPQNQTTNNNNENDYQDNEYNNSDYNESIEENNITYADDEPFNMTQIDDDENEDNNYFILIAIIILLVAGTSGGGYYAYKKGYLDKELKKLGIHVPNKDKQNNKASSPKTKFTATQIQNKSNNDNLKKSNYDSHLRKINNFIDNKINKNNDVFSKFENKNKGKVKGYEDTLIKPKNTKVNIKDQSFDAFYSNFDNNTIRYTNKESVQKEAESFEKYYKSKKEDNETKNSNTKSKEQSKKTKNKKKQ